MAAPLQNERAPTFGELLVDLGQDVSALLHDEIELVKKEARSELRTSLVVLGVAGVLSVAAVLALCTAAVLGLARVLDPAWASLGVGGAIALIAWGFTIVARRGRHSVDRHPRLMLDAREEKRQ